MNENMLIFKIYIFLEAIILAFENHIYHYFYLVVPVSPLVLTSPYTSAQHNPWNPDKVSIVPRFNFKDFLASY
jgi:hypothetical protein